MDSSYKDFLKKEYPSAYDFIKDKSWRPIFFSESVSLPLTAYKQMDRVVKALFRLKNQKEYQVHLSKADSETALKQQEQDSVLMAYDFHLEKEQVKLIEVNTNASGFLLVNSLYQIRNLSYKKAKEDLKKSFQSEWKKFNKNQKLPKKVVLVDTSLFDQKMAIEFFMYKDFFQSMGWCLEICDSQSLKLDDQWNLCTEKGEKVDFVYNRCTDFYFEDHFPLKKAFLNGTCAISPHPREYYLLSDKDRLCDWTVQKEKHLELKQIKNHILHSEKLTLQNKEEVWKNRKKYFFKSRKSHGGKMVYKGSSLTNKKFNELCKIEALIQELSLPSKIKNSEDKEWKVDFRAYVYEDQIQQLAARCYQGQLTNFTEKGSGFSTVHLIE